MKNEKVYEFLSIITQCIIVNFLIVVGTILGLGIFGLGPSLIAGHDVFKNYHLKQEEAPTFRTFVQSYRKNFLLGNLLLLPLSCAMGMVLLDSKIVDKLPLNLEIWGILVLVICQLFLLASMCCILPMSSFYQMRPLLYFRQTRIYLFHNTLVVVIALLWLAFCICCSTLLPGLLPLVSFGAWTFGNAAIFFRFFKKNERLLVKIKQN